MGDEGDPIRVPRVGAVGRVNVVVGEGSDALMGGRDGTGRVRL